MRAQPCEIFLDYFLGISSYHAYSSFMENVTRIAEPDYLPATGMSCYSSCAIIMFINACDSEDILNVRLQTLGVKEHSFDISLSGTHVNWLLYDVGGAVSSLLIVLVSSFP